MSGAGQTRHLRSLSDIYRFPGGLATPGEVDIERPVTVTHDVGRAAAQSAVIYTTTGTLVVTGGGGAAVFGTVERSDVIDTLPQALRQGIAGFELWLLAYQPFITSASAANLNLVSAGVVADDDGPLTEANQRFYIGRFNATAGTTFASGANVPLVPNLDFMPYFHPLPVQAVQLEFVTDDDAGGAITVRHVARWALAPRGVIPQG